MSEHENGNFVLKCGQNQQKYQSFMAISDFALLYRIRRSKEGKVCRPPAGFVSLETQCAVHRTRGQGAEDSPGASRTQVRAVAAFPKNHAETAPVLRAASVRFF